MTPLIEIRPWPTEAADDGFPVRSEYAERFWLPSLGPTAWLFLRHCAISLARAPGGCVLERSALAAELGVGEGRNSPLTKCFPRLEQFELAKTTSRDENRLVLAVRRTVPWISAQREHRLTEARRREHEILRTQAYARTA